MRIWTPNWGIGDILATSFTAITGMTMDASGEKLAVRYVPTTSSPITDIDVRFTQVGSPTNIEYGVFGTTSNAPNDADQKGGWTSSFNPSGTGWTGEKALSSNTGTLTVGNPLWLVVRSNGGTLDGSNSLQLNRLQSVTSPESRVARHYNGTNWTTTGLQTCHVLFVVKHLDGTRYGLHATAAWARSGVNDIYVNGGTAQVQGLNGICGSKSTMLGADVFINKAGTPNDLVMTLYEGDTSRASKTFANAEVITSAWTRLLFTTPYEIPADTVWSILFSQTGTSDSSDYDFFTLATDSTYIAAMMSANWRFISGNGTTPSTLTVSNTEIPAILPIFADFESSFDCAAGAGGEGFPPVIMGG